jgi:hypothetical protein
MVNGALYSPKFKYIAYFCAKSGCSSLRNLFIDMHKNELPENVQRNLTIHNAKDSFQLPDNVNIGPLKKYIMVRNPYTRVVSMYMNKFIGPSGHIKRSMREKNIENPIKGESFLSFLKLLKHLKKNNLLNKVDGHCYEQVHALPEKNDDIEVIKLENIEDELTGFYKRSFQTQELYNKSERMFNKNNMHINKTKTKENGPKNVTNHEFLDDKAVAPPYEAFYNAEARDLVFEIYNQDFKRFGYKKELPF